MRFERQRRRNLLKIQSPISAPLLCILVLGRDPSEMETRPARALVSYESTGGTSNVGNLKDGPQGAEAQTSRSYFVAFATLQPTNSLRPDQHLPPYNILTAPNWQSEPSKA